MEAYQRDNPLHHDGEAELYEVARLALASSPRAEAVGAVVEAARAYRTIARLRFPVASASAPGLVQAQRDICDASDALRKALDALDAEVPHA